MDITLVLTNSHNHKEKRDGILGQDLEEIGLSFGWSELGSGISFVRQSCRSAEKSALSKEGQKMSRIDWLLAFFDGMYFQFFVAGFLVFLLLIAWWCDWGVTRCKHCGQPTIQRGGGSCDNRDCPSNAKRK